VFGAIVPGGWKVRMTRMANHMASDDMTQLPWRFEEIDFKSIERARIADNEELYFLLCASSFIESGSDLYTRNLATYFSGNRDVTDWLTQHWEAEEMQHGRALRAYIHAVWPQFDWEQGFARFFEEYSQSCSVDQFEKTHALEMAARCVVETGTATLYRAISECTDEPVLKMLTERIRADEVRHYKYFFKYFKLYNEVEDNGRFKVLGALVRRLLEIKNDDAEIALRHVYREIYPDALGDTARLHDISNRVGRMVRRNLSADMCIKMLLKPLELSPRIQPGIHYPLAKLTQHVLFR
jgi:rubrerythrin